MSESRAEPGPGQESVWDYPRPPRLESVEKRVKVVFGDVTVAYTSRPKRVLETSHPPVYYFPPEDVRMEHLQPTEGASMCEWKGAARYYRLVTEEREADRAAFTYPNPTPEFAEIEGYIAFYPSLMDNCWVDGEKVQAQEGDFYGGWITSDIVGPFKGAPPAPPVGNVGEESVARLRREYTRAGLSKDEAHPDPVEQFRRWFEAALDAELHEPNAMTLATANSSGSPSARIVLLKGYDERGFVFYTSYTGRKAGEIEENPRAALVFYWGELERQVRVEGGVSRVSERESDAYFASRPPGSRIGAHVSEQSRPIDSRAALEERLRELEREYAGSEITRPTGWGGYRLTPRKVEFWQGRESRLHDRLLYTPDEAGVWGITRLQP